jgi:integrase/recombinase XerD
MAGSPAMSPLDIALGDYLRVRRQLGFELKKDESQLRDFVDFLEQAGAQHITTELALAWARLPVNVRPLTWRQRLGKVRGFARYMVTIDPLTEVPSADLLPARQQRIAPYIYTEEEIVALMSAARGIRCVQRAITFEALIGLLASSGLRLGEALALDRQDVDLTDGVVHIRLGKHQRQRDVPIHPTTTDALRTYIRERERLSPTTQSPALFLNTQGGRLHDRTVHEHFPRLIREAGLDGRGQRGRPRAHDLRHSAAVRILLDWHRDGLDPARELPRLSTFLGHRHPSSTYWYLQAVPELLGLVGDRIDGVFGEAS